MRPTLRTTLGLVAAALLAATSAPGAEAPDAASPKPSPALRHAGDGPGYRTLGDLPLLHVEGEGSRVKPIDTYARQTLKEIYGRESIRLVDAEGDPVQTWSALGALVDFPARPGYWDGQEILLIDMFDYRPFKQMILASSIRRALEGIAENSTTSAADKQAIAEVLKKEEFAESDLDGLLARTKLAKPDRATVEGWAAKLAEGRKWIAPDDLVNAVVTTDGHEHDFLEWFGEIFDRARAASQARKEFKPSRLEQKVIDVGERYVRYEAYRDRNARGIPEFNLLVIPRPYGQEYIAYTGDVVRWIIANALDRQRLNDPELGEAERAEIRKRIESRPESLTPLQENAYKVLESYLEDIETIGGYLRNVARDKQKPPGEDPKFDRNFSLWLRDRSAWVPLRLLMESDLDDLAKAGFPKEKVEAFRASIERLRSSEAASPGALDESAASAVVASARALGEATNDVFYPSAESMARESHFNRFAPFAQAPLAYGAALVLLLISLGITADRRTALGKFDRVLYYGGMAAFLAGIGLEVYGFYLRIRISGWAPVTNMYETVIWVAAVAAVLGLVLELIFRKKYAIVAASGMALLGTLLAANVPLLDSDIQQLTPVLRDNYWLTVHVLTIVSSYAAFTLALGLGLLAVGFYLSATYRRDVGYGEAASPILVSLPLLGLFGFGWWAIAQGWGGSALASTPGYLLVGLIGGAGWVSFMTGLSAAMGEFANRNSRSAISLGLAAMAAGSLGVLWVSPMSRPQGWPEQLPLTFIPGLVAVGGFALAAVSLMGAQSRRVYREALALSEGDAAIAGDEGEAESSSESYESGGVATLSRPSVAEIRSKVAAARPKLDARGQAMQHVASQVKPMSNFLYRAMQVGVLLVAAGTILGGVWADVSWGRFWGWDPKEVWALITLLVYLVPLHGRFAGWVSTFGLIYASVVCYMAVLMAWYGVNFVLGVGLHSYGFVEGGGQGVVLTSALAMIGAASGAAWRRQLGSRKSVA